MTRQTQAWDAPWRGEPKRQAPGGKSESCPLAPGLYVTATPIGNLRDITLRALDVLAAVDLIAVEDTRVTAKLLSAFGIATPQVAYNDHNAPRERPRLLAKLRDGVRIALVSDAGTPLISDPGFKLVREALGQGSAVQAIPGASAPLAALACAGLPTDRFLFGGFLPAKSAERRTRLLELRTIPATLVFFEGPQRLAAALADMADVLGARPAAVARELTKLHEEIRRGELPALARAYAGEDQPKGEITVLVGPPAAAEVDYARVDAALDKALAFMPVRAAVDLVSEMLEAPRREVYARALTRKVDADGQS